MAQELKGQGMRRILAGDVGGTKTRLALFSVGANGVRLLREGVFPSQSYPGLEGILKEFLGDLRGLGAVCLGVPGPVIGDRVKAMNLPWTVDRQSLRRELGTRRVALLNDLVAHAYGLQTLKQGDLKSLNRGQKRAGNMGLIAPGTGLGVAVIFWDGKRHIPSASEGGHTDFAPRTPLEVELLQYSGRRFGHVSYERLISGAGLAHIYRFLRDARRFGREPAWLARMIEKGDPAAVISTVARQKKSRLCDLALGLFTSILGAAAGNLAMTVMAVGGVYIGGGIPPKILWKLKNRVFMEAFLDKGRHSGFMAQIPVKVIMNDRTALLGAASYARGLLETAS